MRTVCYLVSRNQVAALPSWLGSTPVNGMVLIPGTTLGGASLPTGSPYGKDVVGVVDYWNGYCINEDTLDMYGLANGGHTDYAGNQILRCALGNSPGWTQPVATSLVGVIPTESPAVGASTYGDGRPASAHSYYTAQFIRKANRAFLFGQGAVWSSGGVTSDMFAYVPGDSDWENTAGDYQLWGALSGTQTTSVRQVAKHATTEDVYYTATPGGTCTLYRWSISGTTPASASHTNLGATPTNFDLYCSAVDHTRNRIVYWRGNGEYGSVSTTVHIYDISGASWSTSTLTGAAATTITAGGNYQSFQYSAVTDLFYTNIRDDSGATIYTINPSTFAVLALSVTGGSGVPVNVKGLNNRMLYVPALASGSGVGGLIIHVDYATGVYFLRLH